MSWITWRQYRYQGAVAAGLLAVVAVVLLISGLPRGFGVALPSSTAAALARLAVRSDRASRSADRPQTLSFLPPLQFRFCRVSCGARRWSPTSWRPARISSRGP
jgi:hypothetical protein